MGCWAILGQIKEMFARPWLLHSKGQVGDFVVIKCYGLELNRARGAGIPLTPSESSLPQIHISTSIV